MGEDVDGTPLVYSINKIPNWATFTTTTGTLTGMPTNANVGTTTGIVISVTSGGETASLDAFDLEVTIVATSGIVVMDDSESTAEDTSVIISVLENDMPAQGLTITNLRNPSNGIVALTNNNTEVIYTPSANFNGIDTFTYKANAGGSDSNQATVRITVRAVDDIPTIIGNPPTSVAEGAAYTFTPMGEDADGTPLAYSII